MASRWIYRLLTFVAAMFVWLAAGEARAEAPLCDSRGATVLAPAPQLQDAELTLSLGESNDCVSIDETTSLRESKDGRLPWSAASAEDTALTSSSPSVAPATLLSVLDNDEARSRAARGIIGSLDRPPRARAL